jgi:hypothetical protein
LYLRHDYLKKAGTLNGKYYTEFKHIIDITSRIMFKKFYRDFSRVGFLEEDIKSISSVYVLSYMELYSVANNPAEKEKFTKSFIKKNGIEPVEADFKKVESNHMVNFLRQKLSHCAKVCNRKSRNIICGKDKTRYFAFTETSVEADNAEILESYSNYGYRRVTLEEYKGAKEKAKILGESQLVDDDGFKIVKIENITKGIDHYDYKDVVDAEKSEIFMDPESRIIRMEEKKITEEYRSHFNSLNKKEKNSVLENFIEQNKKNKNYKNQIKLARKLLKQDVSVV